MPTAPQIFRDLGIELPLVQAPMAGSMDAELVIASCRAGAMGSLPCAMLDSAQITAEVEKIRAATDKPFNLNFFSHQEPVLRQQDFDGWRETLAPYFHEAGVDAPTGIPAPGRQPFDEEKCRVVEALKPPVVSFHFGLPEEELLDRVKATGALVFSSATTVEEAAWLAERGVDAVIAQGVEAGGHRGMFLTTDISNQPRTEALLPAVREAVNLPVIAAGGIANRSGADAAFAMGADVVQVGTAFLFCNEASPAGYHLEALTGVEPVSTALTNLFSGRPARGMINQLMADIGPMNNSAPPFPMAGSDLAPLKQANVMPARDLSPLWCGENGESSRIYRGKSAAEICRNLMGLD